MRQRIRCHEDEQRVRIRRLTSWIVAGVAGMILSSHVTVYGRQVAGSLHNDWAIASARYDAAVSRIHAIACEQEEKRVVIHDIAPELTAGLGGVITSRNARIAGDRVRVLLVLTERNDTPGWSRESWSRLTASTPANGVVSGKMAYRWFVPAALGPQVTASPGECDRK